jgi:XTP/dITP diphosphohydrolase
MSEKGIAFEKLLNIMDELREKCPWDRKQTMESLRHLTIEETYELAGSILDKDMDSIKKELGDLLLHIVFYAKIADEKKSFDIKDVINSLCEKLVHRHPHIYGDVIVNDEEDVKRNWEQLKLKEGKSSVLEGVPLALPAMIKASRIQDKAKGAGFDWEKSEQVWEKVEEELSEFHHEVQKKSPKEKIENEFGDVLFSLINYARFLDISPEDALERTNKKFITRFQYIETEATKAGKKLSEMTLAEMDVFWNQAKEKAGN